MDIGICCINKISHESLLKGIIGLRHLFIWYLVTIGYSWHCEHLVHIFFLPSWLCSLEKCDAYLPYRPSILLFLWFISDLRWLRACNFRRSSTKKSLWRVNPIVFFFLTIAYTDFLSSKHNLTSNRRHHESNIYKTHKSRRNCADLNGRVLNWTNLTLNHGSSWNHLKTVPVYHWKWVV